MIFATPRKSFSRAKATAIAAALAPALAYLLQAFGFEIPAEVLSGFIVSLISLAVYFTRDAIG